MTARARIVGWMMLLVGLALAASIVLTWRVLLVRADERVDTEIEHETSKLRAFAASATDPATGRPYQRVDALLDRYLQETLPDADEAYFSLVEGRPHHRSLGRPPARLDTDRAFVANVARAREPSHGLTDSPAGEVRYAVLPVQVTGDPREAALVVLEFREAERREVGDAVEVLTLVGFGALAVAGVASWLVAGRVLAPIRLVRQTAERIGESDLTRRISVGGNDDVAQLASTFNRMLDRLEAAFGAQRQFLDDAGHELRTPITVIRGHLELMGDDPADRRETMALVADELDRMVRIVDDLLVLAKAEQPDFLTLAPVEVADLTVGVLAKARALAERSWSLGGLADVTILADGQRLTQALMQLAANAVQHTSYDDSISVGSTSDGERVRLSVTDTGPGVPSQEQERIFDRFARGPGPRRSEGAGLGLEIVRTIARAHGGVVHLDSEVGAGATFTLDLPVRPGTTTPQAFDDRSGTLAP